MMEEEVSWSANVGMAWGVKASFRSYLESMTDAITDLAPGSGLLRSGEVYFSLADGTSFDTASGRGTLRFQGGVMFSGHGGLMRVVLVRPTIFVDGAIGTLTVETPDVPTPIEVASLSLEPPRRSGCVLMWGSASASLSADALSLFNDVYAVGEPLDPVTIRIPIDD